MRFSAQRLANGIGVILAALVIGAALLSLLVRLALPQADLFRDEIGDAFGRLSGVEVTMGRVDARLRGFAPQLALHDVQLRDRGNEELLLELRELRIDLDLSATLREGGLRIDGVTLVGADLDLVRGTDGRILVRGLDALRGDDPGALAFFLRRGRFSLADSKLDWTDFQADVPTVSVWVKRLDLQNRYQRHLLRISARPDGETLGDLTLLADMTGSPHHMGGWSGDLYVRWRGQDLAQLLRGRLPKDLGIESQRVDIESWNRIKAGRPTSTLARVDVGGARLQGNNDVGPGNLGDLHLLARWRPTENGWRLRLADVAFAGVDIRSAVLDFEHRTPANAGRTGSGGTPSLRLSGAIGELPLATLPRLLSIAAEQGAKGLEGLRAYDLDGQIRDLRYRLYLHPDGGPLDWQVQGALQGLRVDQCQDYAAPDPTPHLRPDPSSPPFAGTSGTSHGCAGRVMRLDGLDLVFEAGPGGGYVGLGGQAVELDPTPVLGGVLDLTTLAGDLNWRLDGDGVLDIWTDSLTVDTPDIDTETNLKAQIYTFGASPIVDLRTRLENGRSGNYDRLDTYLPVGIMDDGLERWLLSATRAGTLTSGEASFHGRLRDFPDDCSNEHFELTLNISGGELDYWPPRPVSVSIQAGPEPGRESDAETAAAAAGPARDAVSAELPGWPPVRDLAGSIRFRDRALIIDVARGELRNTRLTGGTARIENLWQPRTLDLTGRAVGPMTDGLWVLKNTPLSQNLAAVGDAFDVTGDAILELSLQIPLRKRVVEGKPKPVPVDYAGALLFDGRPSLTPRAIGMPFTGLDGRLVFDGSGVRAEGVGAQIDGQRVRIALETEQSAGPEGSTRIEIAGRSSVEDLARRFPNPWWPIAEGRADWAARLQIRNSDLNLKEPPLYIEMESNLRGVALSPPAPVGKTAAEARRLLLSTALNGVWPQDLKLSYGDIGSLMQLERQPGHSMPELGRVSIVLDGSPVTLPGSRGIEIGGRLDELDLSSWVAWSRGAMELFGDDSAERLGPGGDSKLPVLPSRLEIGKVKFGGLGLRDLDVRFSPRPDGWSIGFEGGGNGGSVDLPAAGSGGTLRVRLEDLDLKPLTEQDPAARQAQHDDDPRNLGRLALTVESLRFGEDPLGRLLLSTAPISDGVRFGEISLVGPLLRATANGSWTIDATGYSETEIRVDAQSEDFGRLLTALDYYSDIAGAPADAQLSLGWPGGPQAISLQRARGSLTMDLGAGRLLAVDPGVGRMLGLVNLSALTRRLTLDFTDVTDPGFGFDSISGRLSIGGGQARLNPVELLSSTADIRITGVTNLVERTFDQKVQVTPKVGSGVAIAGAVAGGPLLGAAVLLADKVAGGAVDRIGRQDYRVTGPWTNPKIERLSSYSNSRDADGESGTADKSAFGDALRGRSGVTSGRVSGGGTVVGAKPGTKSSPAKPASDDNPFLEGF
ncbi:MAG: AsmA-like C-terminal region-containing protein [Thiohalocapsa sp.]